MHPYFASQVCRNPERGEEARAKIVAATGKQNVTLEIADVSRPPALTALAGRLNARGGGVNAVINNAGCLIDDNVKTPEGFETTLACHTIGTFVLSEALLPSLRRCGDGAVGRVISRWCECCCDIHLCSLHSARANLTISMPLHALQP
jgi:NAD(P)-dependent dehydrogenase (short-subunit alcohol dehydrogenase family)